MTNKVNIYYHKDVDGLTSAALTSRLLEFWGYEPVIKTAIDYPLARKWRSGEMKPVEPFVVVDWPFYNPESLLHADHHKTKEPIIKSEKTKYLCINLDAKSCASIILDKLKESESLNGCELGRLEEMVRWCNIIDSASYKDAGVESVEDVLEPKRHSNEPALIVGKALEATRVGNYNWLWNHFARSLAKNSSYEHLSKNIIINHLYRKAINQQTEAIKELGKDGNPKKKYDILHKILTYSIDDDKWSRYGFVRICPPAVWAVGIRKTNSGAVLVMTKNPWKENHKCINAGEFLEKYPNGGGRDFGGSAFFQKLTDAEEAQEDIVKRIKEANKK